MQRLTYFDDVVAVTDVIKHQLSVSGRLALQHVVIYFKYYNLKLKVNVDLYSASS